MILANGGYAALNRPDEPHGGSPAWPSFSVDVAAVARGFGCPAHRIESYDLLEVGVAPDPTFAP